MPALQRSTVIKRGPRFFMLAGEPMFEFVMDGGSRIGPRPATPEDAKEYPAAFEAMGEEPEINSPTVTFKTVEGAEPEKPPRPHAERRQRALEEGRA